MYQRNARFVQSFLLLLLIIFIIEDVAKGMNVTEKKRLKDQVVEMFYHAYRNYKDHAYPADELMPLSCKGRYRHTKPSRGDIDDSLGDFSLTLVDTLDTLAVLGDLDEFDNAVRRVIRDVSFNRDIVVSVFETNIRMLGGLLGGHVVATQLKKEGKAMHWYRDELLPLAKDLGHRLLAAFNTTTGIPHPRVNLKHGIKNLKARDKDTCTACAGTIILEFAALSRLTGDPIFEDKAHKAMDFLWKQRHRTSDLVGTVINVNSGDWVRRESGIGAGTDSYYEYLLKAYILLGDETYLDRFNKHYEAIMKYMSQGPMMVDVHMHRPLTNSRNFMDALLAFWPGLQVLKGDIKPAIETHEMLYQVTQRHNFLPEAFTTDFRVHWAQHPLRPEFIESTYFIHKATNDPYYLQVGRSVVENLQKYARVPCGFASIKDVTLGTHEDQLDSFVLAETFKYLYLLFSEKEDHVLDVDDFIFTTEAHLLPLSLSMSPNKSATKSAELFAINDAADTIDQTFKRSCPNTNYLFPGHSNYAHVVRRPLKDMVESLCPKSNRPRKRKPRLNASEFIAGNKDQLDQLKKMGIKIVTMKDGRVQLLHTASEAATQEDAEDGMLFMQEMIDLSKQQQQEVQQEPRVIQLLSMPYFGNTVLNAGPAQFGKDLKKTGPVEGFLVLGIPFKGCDPLANADSVGGKIVIVERGDCMFIDKARQLQAAGAIGGIVIDHNEGTSSEASALFAMSGDGKNDVVIPMLFLFNTEGRKLTESLAERKSLKVLLGYQAKRSEEVITNLMAEKKGKATEVTDEKSTEMEEKPVEQSKSETKKTPVLKVSKLDMNDIQKISESLGQSETNALFQDSVKLLKDFIEGPNDNGISQKLGELITGDGDEQISEAYKELVKLLQENTEIGANSPQTIASYASTLKDIIELLFKGMNQDKLNVEKSPEMLHKIAKDVSKEMGNKLQPPVENQKTKTENILEKLTIEELTTSVKGIIRHAKQKLREQAEVKGANIDQVIQDINEQFKTLLGEASHGKQHKFFLPQAANAKTNSYASLEDLTEAQLKDKAPVIHKAPESMNLKDGEFYVDKNGNFYAKEGTAEILHKPEIPILKEDKDIKIDVEESEEKEEVETQEKYTKLDFHKNSRQLFAQQDRLKKEQEAQSKEPTEDLGNVETTPQNQGAIDLLEDALTDFILDEKEKELSQEAQRLENTLKETNEKIQEHIQHIHQTIKNFDSPSFLKDLPADRIKVSKSTNSKRQSQDPTDMSEDNPEKDEL